jgi:hypothetical protein
MLKVLRSRFVSLVLTLTTSATSFGASLDRWLYCSSNLLVDENIQRSKSSGAAAKAGYTHVLLADNVKTCIGMLHEVNPGGRIYVWSDMFDPHHNARPCYYLCAATSAARGRGWTPR